MPCRCLAILFTIGDCITRKFLYTGTPVPTCMTSIANIDANMPCMGPGPVLTIVLCLGAAKPGEATPPVCDTVCPYSQDWDAILWKVYCIEFSVPVVCCKVVFGSEEKEGQPHPVYLKHTSSIHRTHTLLPMYTYPTSIYSYFHFLSPFPLNLPHRRDYKLKDIHFWGLFSISTILFVFCIVSC